MLISEAGLRRRIPRGSPYNAERLLRRWVVLGLIEPVPNPRSQIYRTTRPPSEWPKPERAKFDTCWRRRGV